MILSRADWGAVSAPFTRIPNLNQVQFLTLHRIVDYTIDNHAACLDWLLLDQMDAMNRGLPDITWNAVCCPHGQLYDCLGLEQWPMVNDHIGEGERSASLSLLVLSTSLIGELDEEQRNKIRTYRLHYFGGQYPAAVCVTHRAWDRDATCPGGELANFVAELEAERAGRTP